jgi:hypothetical protein
MEAKEFAATVRIVWDYYDDAILVAPWGETPAGGIMESGRKPYLARVRDFTATGIKYEREYFDTDDEARGWVETQLIERLGLREVEPATS